MANIVEKLEALDGLLDRLIEGQGITPEGTVEITENGKHDVSQYAEADVNVSVSGGGGFTSEGCEFGEFSVDEIKEGTVPLFSIDTSNGWPKMVIVIKKTTVQEPGMMQASLYGSGGDALSTIGSTSGYCLKSTARARDTGPYISVSTTRTALGATGAGWLTATKDGSIKFVTSDTVKLFPGDYIYMIVW